VWYDIFMENTQPIEYNANNCPDSGSVGHKQFEYDGVGYSPCGKYVSHTSDILCDVINSTDEIVVSTDPHNCQCRTDSCKCGTFISHKVSEPCTATV